jgi:hypothetical protein
MHTFKTVLAFTTLVSSIMAVPLASSLPTTPNPTSPSNIMPTGDASAKINDCGNSSFENQSSGGSPLISDCQILVDNIRGDGTWTTMVGDQRQLAQLGTCAFGVYVPGNNLHLYKVGNEDIRNLITDSIRMFGWQGKVGAKGLMPCQPVGGPDDDWVEWSIYHT